MRPTPGSCLSFWKYRANVEQRTRKRDSSKAREKGNHSSTKKAHKAN